MSSARRPRGAFTLFELLVVLVVVLAVLGIAWPAVRGTLTRRRLDQAAEDVRVHLQQARQRAIHSGEVWEVRFVPGRGQMCVVRGGLLDSAEFELDSAVTTSSSETTDQAPLAAEPLEFALPQGVTFLSAEACEQSEGVRDSTTSEAALADNASGPAEWSAPIRFFPDGSADDAHLRLSDRGRSVSIDVEGLTGDARVESLR